MEEFYRRILDYVRSHKFIYSTVMFINRYFPYITFCLYPCVIIYLYIQKSPLLQDSILKPLCAFMIVTLFRKIINRKRPYESMDIKPLIRHKQGESFPSRHSVSAMIIALVCFYVHFTLGIFACIIAIMISVSRVLAGVHYISDVLTAIIIAFIIYWI